jgi:protein AFG1
MRRAAAPYGSLVADLALQAASRQSAASATAAGRSPSAFCASCRRTRLADRRSLSYRSPVGNARFGPPESRREGGGAVRRLDVRHQTIREYAVVAEQVQLVDDSPQAPVSHGPMHEYDARVRAGLLRDDEHQRGELSHLVMVYIRNHRM